MSTRAVSLESHRVRDAQGVSVVTGRVRYSPVKSIWFVAMALAAVIGGLATFRWSAVLLFVVSTGIVLLFGHSLGSHRKLIHNSYQCPKWLEYFLVYCGVQVGLAGPIGLLRQHELRDYAQRLPDCHDYLRHGQRWWRDAWWQLNCELQLDHPPGLEIEPRIADDRFYQFLERTWMAQHALVALLFFAWGGWAFVFWGVCARVTAGVFGHWLIGYFAHNSGHSHFDVAEAAVQGRNIPFTSLLTMGESWHNNHHAFPGSARLGLFEGEWDPGWWVLLGLRQLRLVWGIRLAHDLPGRAELVATDAHSVAFVRSIAFVPSTIPQQNREIVRDQPGLCELIVLATRWRNPNLRLDVRSPGAMLSAKSLAKLYGTSTTVLIEPRAMQLSVTGSGRRVVGLPAVWIGFMRKAGLTRLLALLTLPLAVGLERLRPEPA